MEQVGSWYTSGILSGIMGLFNTPDPSTSHDWDEQTNTLQTSPVYSTTKSSGFHLLELHLPSLGAGWLGCVFAILLGLAVLYWSKRTGCLNLCVEGGHSPGYDPYSHPRRSRISLEMERSHRRDYHRRSRPRHRRHRSVPARSPTPLDDQVVSVYSARSRSADSRDLRA